VDFDELLSEGGGNCPPELARKLLNISIKVNFAIIVSMTLWLPMHTLMALPAMSAMKLPSITYFQVGTY
jgi:hypothetical protein